MSSDGKIAFVATFTTIADESSSSATATGTGIWAQRLDGELQLIAKTGGVLDVDQDPMVDDYRTISSLVDEFALFHNESTFGFNDRGEIAFRARFTDGTSGIFVSSLVAVPEPTTAVLLILGLAAVSRRHR